MTYTVNTTKKTLIIKTSFTYQQYLELRNKYLGYDISIKDEVCFLLN
jgi:hypothetical protein